MHLVKYIIYFNILHVATCLAVVSLRGREAGAAAGGVPLDTRRVVVRGWGSGGEG